MNTDRSKSKTELNSCSSRSHAIYSLILTQEIDGKEVLSTFNIVDLAGAERMNRTKASTVQQREANFINNSLMNLWRCLKLWKSNKKISNIPYRDSKLTHLLIPQLYSAGLDGVTMITCVNPQASDYDETLSILG